VQRWYLVDGTRCLDTEAINHNAPGPHRRAVRWNETTAAVRPLNGRGGGWLQAVRDNTPADTVLLSGDSQQPFRLFTDRAAYVAADGPQRTANRLPPWNVFSILRK